jgi:hypothetical protein
VDTNSSLTTVMWKSGTEAERKYVELRS